MKRRAGGHQTPIIFPDSPENKKTAFVNSHPSIHQPQSPNTPSRQMPTLNKGSKAQGFSSDSEPESKGQDVSNGNRDAGLPATERLNHISEFLRFSFFSSACHSATPPFLWKRSADLDLISVQIIRNQRRFLTRLDALDAIASFRRFDVSCDMAYWHVRHGSRGRYAGRRGLRGKGRCLGC